MCPTYERGHLLSSVATVTETSASFAICTTRAHYCMIALISLLLYSKRAEKSFMSVSSQTTFTNLHFCQSVLVSPKSILVS